LATFITNIPFPISFEFLFDVHNIVTLREKFKNWGNFFLVTGKKLCLRTLIY